MVEGLRYLRSRRVLLGAISLDLFAVLLGSVTALLPIYARDVFGVGPDGLGVMRSSMAVGAVAMGLALAHLPAARQPHAGRMLFAGVALFGIAALAFGLSKSFALSVLMLAAMGASDMMSVFVRASLVQLGTPDNMRGRVSAVHSLFVGTANELGDFRAGAVAAWLGAVPAVLAGGFATLAVVALWALALSRAAPRRAPCRRQTLRKKKGSDQFSGEQLFGKIALTPFCRSYFFRCRSRNSRVRFHASSAASRLYSTMGSFFEFASSLAKACFAL